MRINKRISMQNRTYPILFTSLLVIFLSACAGNTSKATRYYLIDPVVYDSNRALAPSKEVSLLSDDRPLRIEVIDLHIPQYLERFQIATRTGQGRLAFSDSHQWGENLRKNLLRTLARNLSRVLATHDIGTPLNRSASQPDYRLQVYIEQFEQDIDNTVKLMARWQLTKTGQQEPIGIFALELQGDEAMAANNYDEMVAVMRTLYGQLSEKIATTILAREN